ncbi:MAG: hypothetical protein U0905_15840 [Pirellulales bacterium]
MSQVSLPDQPNSIVTDYNNFTGYSQTIVETSKNATGQRIKKIVYTFGIDEISQTIRTYDAQTQSVTTLQHYFSHDGLRSVQVLFDATAAIAQVFTYAAYGELLAIHNRLAQAVRTVNAQGLEKQCLYEPPLQRRIFRLPHRSALTKSPLVRHAESR